MIKLPAFKALCNADAEEVLDVKEPLSTFFSYCGKRYHTSSEDERKNIAYILQTALSGFEKLTPISESPPTMIKIHVVIGLIIFNCAPIVYVHVS